MSTRSLLKKYMAAAKERQAQKVTRRAHEENEEEDAPSVEKEDHYNELAPPEPKARPEPTSSVVTPTPPSVPVQPSVNTLTPTSTPTTRRDKIHTHNRTRRDQATQQLEKLRARLHETQLAKAKLIRHEAKMLKLIDKLIIEAQVSDSDSDTDEYPDTEGEPEPESTTTQKVQEVVNQKSARERKPDSWISW
jgi:hypothetical protein